MAHVLTGPTTSPMGAAAKAAGFAVAQLRRIAVALENRRAVRALGEYDAVMLKDIGLIPSDIDAALSRPLSQDPSAHLANVAAGRCRHGRLGSRA